MLSTGPTPSSFNRIMCNKKYLKLFKEKEEKTMSKENIGIRVQLVGNRRKVRGSR